MKSTRAEGRISTNCIFSRKKEIIIFQQLTCGQKKFAEVVEMESVNYLIYTENAQTETGADIDKDQGKDTDTDTGDQSSENLTR